MGMDLKGKKVAVFGLGDQGGYGDNFCDAMDELVSCFSKQGADVIGSWSADGYDHMGASRSVATASLLAFLATRTTNRTSLRSAPTAGSPSSSRRECLSKLWKGHAPWPTMLAGHGPTSHICLDISQISVPKRQS